MTDRDKVIKAIQDGIDFFEDRAHGPRFESWIRAQKDALALLRAQEPRVMTLDEVVTAKPGTVVWLEDFDKPDVISGLLKRLFIYTKVIDFLIVKEEVNNEVTADLEVYDSGWRCWTSRPNDEQREATPWN